MEGERQLAILRLLGLFDRPAPADCVAVLRRAPRILGLSEPLVGLTDAQWNLAVSRLAARNLVSTEGGTLDAHPLVREYFGRQLRERHPDTLEGLQPLYQAVAHGCHSGR